jgi:UDP-hydrolysing UDP-N-acetyl-D-glucosamine 2-epimerase
MGEDPSRVHNVGYPGIDQLELIPLEAAKHLAGISSYEDFLLVVWHPDTLVDKEENLRQVHILMRALDKVFMKTLVVGPNTDNGNEVIKKHLKFWCHETKNTYVDELPRKTYLTLLKHCKCLVGNSSSGFYEAPSFYTRVVDIGDRQKGREPPHNVARCPVNVVEIARWVEYSVSPLARIITGSNPYGDGLAGQRIASIIARIDNPKKLLRKKWHDVGTTTSNSNEQLGFDTLWGNSYKVQITNEIPLNEWIRSCF